MFQAIPGPLLAGSRGPAGPLLPSIPEARNTVLQANVIEEGELPKGHGCSPAAAKVFSGARRVSPSPRDAGVGRGPAFALHATARQARGEGKAFGGPSLPSPLLPPREALGINRKERKERKEGAAKRVHGLRP